MVSSPLRAHEAERFALAFKDKFKAYYVFSGEYYANGQGLKYPKYFVVRLPEKNEPYIDWHEMEVSRGELLETIREYRGKEKASIVTI